MNDEEFSCNICGSPATHTLGHHGLLPLCNSVVCHHTTIEMIKEALALDAQGAT